MGEGKRRKSEDTEQQQKNQGGSGGSPLTLPPGLAALGHRRMAAKSLCVGSEATMDAGHLACGWRVVGKADQPLQEQGHHRCSPGTPGKPFLSGQAGPLPTPPPGLRPPSQAAPDTGLTAAAFPDDLSFCRLFLRWAGPW